MPTFPATASFPVVYDPAAVTYFNRALVTNSTSKTRISAFIATAKADGTWALMSEGWLCIDTQNAGGGSTLHALKTSANNGSFVATPLWKTNGIAFASASSQKITTAFAPTGGDITVFATYNATAGSALLAIASRDDIGSNRDWSLYYDGSTDKVTFECFNPSYSAVTITSPEGQFRSVIARVDATQLKIHDFVNTEVSGVAGSITGGTAGAMWLGARQNGAGDLFFNGTVAHVFYFSSALNDTQKAAFYTNVKATIGAGLSLP